MKKIIIFSMICLLLVACGSKNKTEELLDYMNNNIPKLAEMEQEMISDYNNLISDDSINDEKVYEELNNKIIPLAQDLHDVAENMLPSIKDPDLKDIHKVYIEYTDAYLSYFKTVASSNDIRDPELFSVASEKFEEAKKLAENYSSSLKSLIEKYNLAPHSVQEDEKEE